MTEPENSSDPAVTIASLQQTCQALRTLLHAIILILLVLSLSVNLFIWREAITKRREVEERKRIVMDYEKNSVPVMNEFLARLQEFARSNADFAPILAKYGKPTNVPAASPPRVPAMPKN